MRLDLFFGIIIAITAILPGAAAAQYRDYLTDQEIELVRDAQQIDDRIDVLIHAIDRRLTVLSPQTVPAKKEKMSSWGPPPEGTRLQLLNDIKLILQKAIDDIDNLAERPDSMVIDTDKDRKDVKGFSDLFPKAVRSLGNAAGRFEAIFKAQLDLSPDKAEKGILLDSVDKCDQIIASVAKLPELKKEKH